MSKRLVLWLVTDRVPVSRADVHETFRLAVATEAERVALAAAGYRFAEGRT